MINSLKRRLFSRGATADPAIKDFVRLQKDLWQAERKNNPSDGVVLFSLYHHPGSVIANSYLGNAIANIENVRIGYYTFDQKPSRKLEALYQSAGAKPEIVWKDIVRHEAKAKNDARDLLSHITSKEDILTLEYGDIFVGDLIYDSYLRSNFKPTVDLKDPLFFEIAWQILRNINVFRSYFVKNRVVALYTDHHYYHVGGAAARVARKQGIPVIFYAFSDPFFLSQAPAITAHNGSKVPARHNSENFPGLFAALPDAKRREALDLAGKRLRSLLAGEGENLIYGQISPYGKTSAERLLPETGRPRVLVMLQEFCDAPNVLGPLLFPDFYEWIFYLLERAAQTPFDWIIKPHACLQTRERKSMNDANFRVVEEIHARYPQFTILDATCSNRQILEEGISSMFTVRGSAGYEFAYRGVPVVTAGKSHYSAFKITNNATTREEFDQLISNADKLTCPAKKQDIETFYYMFRDYFVEQGSVGMNFFPDTITESPDYPQVLGQEVLYDLFSRKWTSGFHQKLCDAVKTRAGKCLEKEPRILTAV